MAGGRGTTAATENALPAIRAKGRPIRHRTATLGTIHSLSLLNCALAAKPPNRAARIVLRTAKGFNRVHLLPFFAFLQSAAEDFIRTSTLHLDVPGQNCTGKA